MGRNFRGLRWAGVAVLAALVLQPIGAGAATIGIIDPGTISDFSFGIQCPATPVSAQPDSSGVVGRVGCTVESSGDISGVSVLVNGTDYVCCGVVPLPNLRRSSWKEPTVSLGGASFAAGGTSSAFSFDVFASDGHLLDLVIVLPGGSRGILAVDLFQPAVDVAKVCDPVSTVGSSVGCTVSVWNSSSADSPVLLLDSVEDSMVGDLNGTLTRGTKTMCPAFPTWGLAADATWSCSYSLTVGAADPDPLTSSVTAHLHPYGYPATDVTSTDTASIALFQTGVDLAEDCPSVVIAGASVRCRVTVTNVGSADGPPLAFLGGELTDAVAGDLLGPDGPLTAGGVRLASSTCTASTWLAPGSSCSVDYEVMTGPSDRGALTHHTSVRMHPLGFPQDVVDDVVSVTRLAHPAFTITATCASDSVRIGANVLYNVVVRNDGDEPLDVVASIPAVRAASGRRTTDVTSTTVHVAVGSEAALPSIAMLVTVPTTTADGSVVLPVSATATVAGADAPSLAGWSATHQTVGVCDVALGEAAHARGFWGTRAGSSWRTIRDVLAGMLDLS